jgi:hypothetical protein
MPTVTGLYSWKKKNTKMKPRVLPLLGASGEHDERGALLLGLYFMIMRLS